MSNYVIDLTDLIDEDVLALLEKACRSLTLAEKVASAGGEQDSQLSRWGHRTMAKIETI